MKTEIEVLSETSKGELLTYKIIVQAMNDFAQQQAVEFKEWEMQSGFYFSKGKWIEKRICETEGITTKELYQLFLKQQPCM